MKKYKEVGTKAARSQLCIIQVSFFLLRPLSLPRFLYASPYLVPPFFLPFFPFFCPRAVTPAVKRDDKRCNV